MVSTIDRRGKARPHGDDGRRHVARGAQVALGQNRVDHSRGFKLIEHLGLRVHRDGNIPRLGNLERLCRRLRQASANALDLDLAQANSLAKTDCAADARGNRDIGHKRAFPGHLPVLRFEQSKSGSTATLMIIYYHSIIRR